VEGGVEVRVEWNSDSVVISRRVDMVMGRDGWYAVREVGVQSYPAGTAICGHGVGFFKGAAVRNESMI
jgi:hypothetical protein